MREVLIESLKTRFLKDRISSKTRQLFLLNFTCSFSILSGRFLTLSKQFKSIFAPAMASQKLSIKYNNFSRKIVLLAVSPNILFPSHTWFLSNSISTSFIFNSNQIFFCIEILNIQILKIHTCS